MVLVSWGERKRRRKEEVQEHLKGELERIAEKYPKESDSYKNYADRCLNCGLRLHVPEKYCPNCGKLMDSWKDK
jgi:uncharacterized OB-fold protein